jgi:site-specific recombinase XerD
VTQAKGRRERQLPLMPSVRKALAHYLRRARPAIAHRRVFVGFPSGQPLSNQRVSQLVAAALCRAQLVFRRPGAHLLRHTFATHLAQRGASVKAIADCLGHRGLDTAGRYIHVYQGWLQTVVQPWPEVAA